MAGRRQAVFLRGVNVGRAKRISSAQLRDIVAGTGATDVATLLNSGNAVCTSSRAPDRLAASVASAIGETMGFTCDVVVRTESELDLVLARDPLGPVARDPSRYLVTFLGAEPAPSAVEALRALDVSPDEWVLEGRELYAWLPPGVADSLLFKYLAKGRLGVTWTGRNWTTVTRTRSLL
jgi:uncharacterized protein (DUF1697 family)